MKKNQFVGLRIAIVDDEDIKVFTGDDMVQWLSSFYNTLSESEANTPSLQYSTIAGLKKFSQPGSTFYWLQIRV